MSVRRSLRGHKIQNEIDPNSGKVVKSYYICTHCGWYIDKDSANPQKDADYVVFDDITIDPVTGEVTRTTSGVGCPQCGTPFFLE